MNNVVIFTEKPYLSKFASKGLEVENKNGRMEIKPCELFPNGAIIVTGIGIIQLFLADLYISNEPITEEVLKGIVDEIQAESTFEVFSTYAKEQMNIIKESFEQADVLVNFCEHSDTVRDVFKILYFCTESKDKIIQEINFIQSNDFLLNKWNDRKNVNVQDFHKEDSRLEKIVTFLKSNM